MPTCIACGYENDNIATFCLSCGNDLSSMQKRDKAAQDLDDLDETKMESQSDIKVSDLPDMPQSEPLMYPTPMPMVCARAAQPPSAAPAAPGALRCPPRPDAPALSRIRIVQAPSAPPPGGRSAPARPWGATPSSAGRPTARSSGPRSR